MSQTLGQILTNVESGLEKFYKHAYLAAETVQNDFIERIFDEGLDADGQDIAKYSTKPTYVSGSRKKSQAGFYEGGYAAFKKRINKTKAAQRGVYDVTLTGETRFEFSKPLEQVTPLKYELRVQGEAAKKASYINSMAEKENIFILSEDEMNKMTELLVEGLDNLLNGR